MARRKAGEQARRDARAQALGYASDYDYRAHGYGRRAPGEPRLRGPALRAARGHTGAGDLVPRLEGGRVELVNVIQIGPGEYEMLVTDTRGRTRVYQIKGEAQRRKVQAALVDLGADGPKIVGSPKTVKSFK